MDRFDEMMKFAKAHGHNSIAAAFSILGKSNFIRMFENKEYPEQKINLIERKISIKKIVRVKNYTGNHEYDKLFSEIIIKTKVLKFKSRNK